MVRRFFKDQPLNYVVSICLQAKERSVKGNSVPAVLKQEKKSQLRYSCYAETIFNLHTLSKVHLIAI